MRGCLSYPNSQKGNQAIPPTLRTMQFEESRLYGHTIILKPDRCLL